MLILELKNNLKNGDFFKRRVYGARFNRGKSIPNKNIISLSVETTPSIKVIAEIQGSGSSRYVINILEETNSFTIIHNCPDFKNTNSFCKHIVKILLLLETPTCQKICSYSSRINFTSDFSLVKKSKTKSYDLKADDLIQQKKYYEAIDFLNQAFVESGNFDYIQKIGKIALKYKFYDIFLKYIVKYKELANQHLNDINIIINEAITDLKNHNFSQKIEISINIQRIFENLSEDLLLTTIRKAQIDKIRNLVLKYLLIHKLKSKISFDDYFKEVPSKLKRNLKTYMADKTSELMTEAILNMESEEEIDSIIKIASNCKFDNYHELNNKALDYKKKLKEIYLEGLRSKHAFLRSMVIANTNTDKLRQMKFVKKYKYPTLIWTSPYKNESLLHYYILEKCGFESHHLEYTEATYFIENYPVFAEIFSGNDPVKYEVKSFWGIFEPKIINTVYNKHLVELDLKLNFHELENQILIEWDLAQRPILGSYICQFSDSFLIPDKTHPLTHEIQPFDLLLCEKKPVAIMSNNIKIIKPLRRINVKSAIELIWSGIEYISSYMPLKLIEDLKNFKIDELDALDMVETSFTKSFLPKKVEHKKLFFEFIQHKIIKDLNNTYLKVIATPKYEQKVLRMIGFERYSQIFNNSTKIQPFKKDNLKRGSLQELKLDLKKFVSKKLAELIDKKDFASINLKSLRKFPSFKNWNIKIIYELKNQLEKCKIYKKSEESFDITNLIDNYYGRIIAKEVVNEKILNNNNIKGQSVLISEREFSKINESFKYLNLSEPKIVEKAG